MNFRTESFDLPQNEQRRCLSCDIAVTQREAHARASRGRGGYPRVNSRVGPGQERRSGLVKVFTSPNKINYLAPTIAVSACAAMIWGWTMSPRLVMTLSIQPAFLCPSADS